MARLAVAMAARKYLPRAMDWMDRLACLSGRGFQGRHALPDDLLEMLHEIVVGAQQQTPLVEDVEFPAANVQQALAAFGVGKDLEDDLPQRNAAGEPLHDRQVVLQAVADFSDEVARELEVLLVFRIGDAHQEACRPVSRCVDLQQGVAFRHFPAQPLRRGKALSRFARRPGRGHGRLDVELGLGDHRLDLIEEVGMKPLQPVHQLGLAVHQREAGIDVGVQGLQVA